MRWLAVVASLMWLAGCGKVNEENFAKLQSGMDAEEVTAILGNAESCEDTFGFRSCRWGDDSRYIKVKYIGKKVVGVSKKGLN